MEMLKWYFALLYRVRDRKNGLLFFFILSLSSKNHDVLFRRRHFVVHICQCMQPPTSSSASFHFHLPIFSHLPRTLNHITHSPHTYMFVCVCFILSQCVARCRRYLSSSMLRNAQEEEIKRTTKKQNNFLFTHFLLAGFIFIFAVLLFCIFHSVAMNNAARTVPSTSASATIISLSSWIWRVECERTVVHIWFRFTTHSLCFRLILLWVMLCARDYPHLHHAWTTKYDGRAHQHTHSPECIIKMRMEARGRRDKKKREQN